MRVFFLTVPVLICSSSVSPRRVTAIGRPSGRLVEVYSDEFRARLEPDAALRLDTQLADDIANDEFTPDIASLWTERTPLGPITLGARLHRGAGSTVFQINEFPDLLIKYQVHCTRLNHEIHPLLRDGWYMNATHELLGKSPVVHFISSPGAICTERSGKCDFKLTTLEWQSCMDQLGPLRYMILERLPGQSLHHFRMSRYSLANGAMGFRNAMVIGRELIRLLRQLHEEANIVHGDIHTPNIMLVPTHDDRQYELKLIDFGSAFNRSNTTLSDTPVWSIGYWFHPFFTQWQIDGYAWGPRDDVMRAIQTIAHLMNTYDYFELENRIAESGYRALETWKLHGNWFIVDTETDPVAALDIPEEYKRSIHGMLNWILKLGRGMKINQRPPYEDLMAVLTQCLDHATVTRTVVTTTITPSLETTSKTDEE